MTNPTLKMMLLALLTLAVLTTAASTQPSTDCSGATIARVQVRGYLSADTLRKWCQRQPARAADYVAGVLDALMLASNDVTRNTLACIPAEVTLEQARDVVCKHLAANPAKRQYNTATLVWTAQ
jgi:hypothetical protein